MTASSNAPTCSVPHGATGLSHYLLLFVAGRVRLIGSLVLFYYTTPGAGKDVYRPILAATASKRHGMLLIANWGAAANRGLQHGYRGILEWRAGG